ncbi:putative Integrase catalytic domain-containing protein [Pararobbsia alpina]|uniref:integrase domain-containing protein n=1 Tax=Pararobbsia alpina TaxID=621374 RepID=UPI0039A42EA2
MGKKAKLRHEAVVISRRCGGSRRHQQNRHQLIQPLLTYLQVVGSLPDRIKDVDQQCAKEYFRVRVVKGDTPGHLHNIASALRVVLRNAGRDTQDFSNADLSIPPRDRTGKRQPISDSAYISRMNALRIANEGLYHVAKLSRLLGLRTMEALMCGPSLLDWVRALEIGPVTALYVTRGTKNGRHREVEPIFSRVTETQAAVSAAMEFYTLHGALVGIPGDLKTSAYKMRRIYRSVGFRGEYSPHTLRYAYACDKAIELLSQGMTNREVLVRLSRYLGHGDSRYRWIKSVYCRSLIDVFAQNADNMNGAGATIEPTRDSAKQ